MTENLDDFLNKTLKYMDASMFTAEKRDMLIFTRWLAEISLNNKVPVKHLYDRWVEACRLIKKGKLK